MSTRSRAAAQAAAAASQAQDEPALQAPDDLLASLVFGNLDEGVDYVDGVRSGVITCVVVLYMQGPCSAAAALRKGDHVFWRQRWRAGACRVSFQPLTSLGDSCRARASHLQDAKEAFKALKALPADDGALGEVALVSVAHMGGGGACIRECLHSASTRECITCATDTLVSANGFKRGHNALPPA